MSNIWEIFDRKKVKISMVERVTDSAQTDS